MNFLRRWSSYFLTYCEIQGILTCISLPFLIAWGLPLSIMSFVGNFCGTPLITLFLGLSTLLFITEICFIPNSYIVYALEQLTVLIIYLLNLGSKQWLLALPTSALFSSIIACIIIIFFYYYKYHWAHYKRVAVVVSLCISTCMVQKFLISPSPCEELFTSKTLYVTGNASEGFTLHDNGCFSRHSSPEKYVQFELRPYLIKQLGTINLATLELHRFNTRTLKAAEALSLLCSVSKIIIHKGTKPVTKRIWRLYYELKKSLPISIQLIN